MLFTTKTFRLPRLPSRISFRETSQRQTQSSCGPQRTLTFGPFGTAKSKVKDADIGSESTPRPGIDAFRRLHAWYTLVGGQGLSASRTKLIAPTPVSDAQVLNALEAYERDTAKFRDLGGEEIPDAVRGQALRNMLAGETAKWIMHHCLETEYV